MPDYASNSDKSKEERTEKEPVDKHVVKVVTSDVIKKPKTISRKFKDIFFGGDAKSAVRYVSADVLLPALRDLIVDVVARGTERMIYGESGGRPSRRPEYPSRVSYNRVSNPLDSRYTPPRGIPARLPDQAPGWNRSSRQSIGDVVIASREEAESVVVQLIEIIDQYQVVSVADYYATLGLEATPIDNKWGWTYLNSVQVRQVRQGYVLDLPPVEEL